MGQTTRRAWQAMSPCSRDFTSPSPASGLSLSAGTLPSPPHGGGEGPPIPGRLLFPPGADEKHCCLVLPRWKGSSSEAAPCSSCVTLGKDLALSERWPPPTTQHVPEASKIPSRPKLGPRGGSLPSVHASGTHRK